MAPPKGKKKVEHGKKKRKVPQGLDENRFVSMDAQERYYDLYENKGFIPERNIDLHMPADNPIMTTIHRRKWEMLVNYAEDASSAIVKEFYSNAELEDLHMTKVSKVRGVDVHFDAATIEFFLLTNFDQTTTCQYYPLYARMQPSKHKLYRDDFPVMTEMVRKGITNPYSKWELKGRGITDKLNKRDLTGECRFWLHFVNANILPSTNLTDVSIERAALLYTLIGEERLNIAAVLSNRICHMVRGSRKKELLGFPSLINHLCIRAGVYIPSDEEFDVKPASYMTYDTYMEHCSKAEVEFKNRARLLGADRPPSPRVPRMRIQHPGPEPDEPAVSAPGPAVFAPGFAAFAPGPTAFAPGPTASAPGPTSYAPGPTASHQFPTGFDFYGLQQQLSRISLQNEKIIMQGEYHSQFLECAYPGVPYATFQPVYPDIPPPYVYQHTYPAPPPADVPMPPRPFLYTESQQQLAQPSYSARRVVYDDGDDSDE